MLKKMNGLPMTMYFNCNKCGEEYTSMQSVSNCPTCNHANTSTKVIIYASSKEELEKKEQELIETVQKAEKERLDAQSKNIQKIDTTTPEIKPNKTK